jgi:hypothetical protein
MRYRFFSNLTNLMTFLINTSIKLKWWKMVNKLTEFKKKHLSKWFRDYLHK